VRSELNLDANNCAEDTAPWVQFIINDAPKIFLALVALSWGTDVRRYLEQFRKLNFNDARLPVEMAFCRSDHAFAGWSTNRQSKMYESQWKHFAPIFSKDNFNPKLDPRQPLPSMERDPRSNGASSTVYRVEVHPAHLKDPPLDVSRFSGGPSCSGGEMTDC
jgi:hypothetical protein